MKKYDSYKDSGIKWIGEIPSHWELSKSKFEINVINGFAFKSEDFEDEGTPVIRIGDLKPPYVDLSNAKCIDTTKYKDLKPYSIIHGDLLLAMTGATIGKTATYVNDEISYLNQRVGLIKPLKNNNSGFTKYIYDSYFFREFVNLECSGSAQENIGKSQLGELKIAVPNSDEQNAIAYYLDQKTTQIDHLVAKKEQFIQLLEEERVAVINQAVTKGLDPTVQMKDSGIDWLGEIPAHWEVKKLRFIGNCQNGISAGAEYFGTGYPFVSYGDVYKNEILPISVNGLAQSNEKEQLHYSIDEGDVLFTRTSETIEEIGISSICFQKIHNAVFAGFLIRFRPNECTLNKNFSKYFFRSKIPRTFFVKEMNLVTRASLSQELLKRLPILLPSIDEQKNIGEFLNKKTNEIDDIVGKTRNEIELLKEYKSALISEVVTGKVDVRNEKLN